MHPDDRLAALSTLVFIAGMTITLTWVAGMITYAWRHRPVVTKDPHTGDLYIPRSDLHVGPRTRRHR